MTDTLTTNETSTKDMELLEAIKIIHKEMLKRGCDGFDLCEDFSGSFSLWSDDEPRCRWDSLDHASVILT